LLGKFVPAHQSLAFFVEGKSAPPRKKERKKQKKIKKIK